VRRVVGEVFARPEFQWLERRRIVSWLQSQWLALIEWLDRLAEQHPVGYAIGLVLIIVVVLLLAAHIGYVVWRIVRPSAGAGGTAAPGGVVILDAGSHLARAAELARAGRYAEALGHRFLAVVLALERLDALRFHSSKTPAEYVGEARLDETGRASLAALVAQLYRHLFGAVPCDRTQYEAFGTVAQELARGRHVVPA
jgi:hypothetical protein